MKYVIDHDFHIHSKLSPCSGFNPAQTTEFILQRAVENGYNQICLTDHFWDEKIPVPENGWWYPKLTYEYLCEALPLPQNQQVKFYFGCEAEMDKFDKIAITRETIDKFDFVIISTTHLHMEGLTIDSADKTLERRAVRYVERFEALLDMDLPFHKMGIAHLTTVLIVPNEETMQLRQASLIRCLDMISDEKFLELFTRAAQKGLGIELNLDSYAYDEQQLERILRPYRIAKSCGCKFYFGSDAHSPKGFEGKKERVEKVVELLGLEEKDKFRFAHI